MRPTKSDDRVPYGGLGVKTMKQQIEVCRKIKVIKKRTKTFCRRMEELAVVIVMAVYLVLVSSSAAETKKEGG